MRLYEYFDVDNTEHLRAFMHLHEHGCWPPDFFAQMERDGVYMDSNMAWIQTIMGRMALRWAEMMVAEGGASVMNRLKSRVVL